MIYSNFFSPPVISLLFCLHENTVEGQEKDPRSPVVQFLIRKILSITDSGAIVSSSRQFEEQMLVGTGSSQSVQSYREAVGQIGCFNDFYRQLSKMLKTLRSLRNNKLQQGNLIDFLVRRMYIYFEKLDFQEIIRIYERFTQFLRGEPQALPQHEFMLTRSIEELKFNLQNYPQLVDTLAPKVEALREYDHTHKSSYLWGVVGAEQSKPLQATEAMHRYFDKSLGNLFQEKSEASLVGNKINHCILSGGFLSLKMGGLEECLQAVSEGLRISQNNSDEESINNCIIYLYKVAQQLGRHQEQILLNEQAITHSLNLTNSLLMVYSCLNYSLLEKTHPCHDPNILLLKNRNIAWTDALHFSRKKLYATFESNCKNIYHSHRSLLLPTFLAKLAVLTHLPQLTPLLLNPYYQREELTSLHLYQQFQGKSVLSPLVHKTEKYTRNGQPKLLQKYLQALADSEERAGCPLDVIKVRQVRCKAKLLCSWLSPNREEIEQLIEQCLEWGFVREELLQARLLAVRLLMRQAMMQEALVALEEVLAQCEQQKLKEGKVSCLLFMAQTQLQLGELSISASLLQSIQHDNQLIRLAPEYQVLFLQTKSLLLRSFTQQLAALPECNQEIQYLKQEEAKCLEELLELLIQRQNFVKVQGVLEMIEHLALQTRREKARKTLEYCRRVISHFWTLETEDYDEEELASRIAVRMKSAYFG